jgi:hypothetical protein
VNWRDHNGDARGREVGASARVVGEDRRVEYRRRRRSWIAWPPRGMQAMAYSYESCDSHDAAGANGETVCV